MKKIIKCIRYFFALPFSIACAVSIAFVCLFTKITIVILGEDHE